MTLAVDTSVSVPLTHRQHRLHHAVSQWAAGRSLALAGHALVETYSVLTRLPGDLKLSPVDAHTLIRERFSPPLHPSPETLANLTATLGRLDVSGGAVYDALVALAALDNEVHLASRDGRARAIYEAVGVGVHVVPS